jgi:Predicted membrane protein (DUF2127)
VDEHKLRTLSVGTFFYAALAAAEGIGLAMCARWAEYLTVVTTASLLPIEVYELVRRPDVPRVLILLVNLGRSGVPDPGAAGESPQNRDSWLVMRLGGILRSGQSLDWQGRSFRRAPTWLLADPPRGFVVASL